MTDSKAVVPEFSAPSETAAAPLTLRLFGPMQAWRAGRPVSSLRSRKSLWLLALLVLRHGRPVEREWLAGTLWPDADPEQALASLRPALSDLRKALGDEGERLQTPNRHSLQFSLKGADVDVSAFDAAIVSGGTPALARAVALYRGPLLEGCTEEWIGQERLVREQDCLRALGILANAALTAGDHEAAAEYSRRAVALDPWSDAARRGLMEALARRGDVNAALRAYREFVAVLRDDPKAVPDQETSALYARLRSEARRQASSLAHRPAPAVPETTVPAVTGYLPHPLTDLVGREDERLEVAAKLRRSRLVTLTGSGGIGKTRLALAVAGEAAPDFTDGVWLVPLEALSDGTQVAAQVAAGLGLKEVTGLSPLQSMTDHLRLKRLLLVLDNCEHLRDASAQLAGHLLRECAGVRVLATSREALGVTGETAWAVPGLAVPDPAHLPPGQATLLRVMMGYEGVQLFVERAQAVQKTFSLTGGNALSVAQVCARLDGIPLALELAAARVKAMTTEQIAARLDDHLGLLTGGSRISLPRHQTLRATLDWSYSHLDERERTLLARLSVFAGGWDLEAAEAVCADKGVEAGQILDLHASLTDKSLVVFEARETGGRYRLLEMVRQYAAERLEASGEAARTRTRHQDHFLALSEEAEPEMKGAEQALWLRRLDAEHDNLRAALEWADRDARRAEAGLRLAGALWPFWSARGHYSEGRRHLRRALGRAGEPAARAKALDRAGDLACIQGDSAEARSLHEEGLSLYRELGDKKGMAASLNHLGAVAHGQGDYASAWRLHQESLSLYQEVGHPAGVASSLGSLGGLARQRGDYASARALHGEALSIQKKLGDLRNVAVSLNNLGNMERLQGDVASAKALYEEALGLRRELGDKPGVAWSLSSLGMVAFTGGDYALSRALHEEALSIRKDLGHKSGIAWSLHNLGAAALLEGAFAEARARLEECLGLFRELGDKLGCAWSLGNLGTAAHNQGEDSVARARLGESLHIFQELGDREGAAGSLQELAAVLMVQGEARQAVRLWGLAHALRVSMGASLPTNEQDEYDRRLAQARAALGEDAFAAAWNAGRALSWEQAAEEVSHETPCMSSPR